MKKHILFISDLHLTEDEPHITELFLNLLTTQALNADVLYILGDFFEVWVGDDDDTPYYRVIKNALKEYIAHGKKCFIMPGNRDFLIGKKFMQETGATFLADPTIINYHGQKILLTHGDSLCTDDARHQIYRKIIQHPVVKFISRLVPLSYRKKLALKLRHASRQHFLRNDAILRDVTTKAVINAFSKNRVDIILHGHTHTPGVHLYDGNKKRYVLGAWHKAGHAWELNESFEELKILSQDVQNQ